MPDLILRVADPGRPSRVIEPSEGMILGADEDGHPILGCDDPSRLLAQPAMLARAGAGWVLEDLIPEDPTQWQPGAPPASGAGRPLVAGTSFRLGRALVEVADRSAAAAATAAGPAVSPAVGPGGAAGAPDSGRGVGESTAEERPVSRVPTAPEMPAAGAPSTPEEGTLVVDDLAAMLHPGADAPAAAPSRAEGARPSASKGPARKEASAPKARPTGGKHPIVPSLKPSPPKPRSAAEEAAAGARRGDTGPVGGEPEHTVPLREESDPIGSDTMLDQELVNHRPHLIVATESIRDKAFFDRRVFRIGRRSAPGEEIYVIPDDGVSGLHAEISFDGRRFWVTDLGSKNHTWVRGEKLEPHERRRLDPGDPLRFGAVDAVFLTEFPDEPAERVDQYHAELVRQLRDRGQITSAQEARAKRESIVDDPRVLAEKLLLNGTVNVERWAEAFDRARRKVDFGEIGGGSGGDSKLVAILIGAIGLVLLVIIVLLALQLLS